MLFPLVFEHDYDDIFFRIRVTIDNDIPEYTEKIECSENFIFIQN